MKAQIGKCYMVPCVRHSIKERMVWVPIHGGRFADPELGNPNPHYHIDIRFISDAMYRWMSQNKQGYVPHVIRVLRSAVDLPIVHRRLRCYRQFGTIVDSTGRTDECWEIAQTSGEKFETLMENARVINDNGCPTCPHKGIPLDGARVVRGNTVECPG